jgi:hypothetical protein
MTYSEEVFTAERLMRSRLLCPVTFRKGKGCNTNKRSVNHATPVLAAGIIILANLSYVSSISISICALYKRISSPGTGRTRNASTATRPSRIPRSLVELAQRVAVGRTIESGRFSRHFKFFGGTRLPQTLHYDYARKAINDGVPTGVYWPMNVNRPVSRCTLKDAMLSLR